MPLAIYADYESTFKLTEDSNFNLEESYTNVVNQHIPSGFCANSKFAYGEIENSLKLYRGKDCVKAFCDYIKNKVKRLYHMFPEEPRTKNLENTK